METTIPFAGFYESLHSAHIDHMIESSFSLDSGETIPSIIQAVRDSINWKKLENTYALAYTELFAKSFHIKLTYKDKTSPREYNFETDRIFADISLDEVKRLFNEVDKTTLRSLIRERFTSYDGFISFYDNNLDDWPENLADWDCNQVGTLVQAYAMDNEYSDDWEFYSPEYLTDSLYNYVALSTIHMDKDEFESLHHAWFHFFFEHGVHVLDTETDEKMLVPWFISAQHNENQLKLF